MRLIINITASHKTGLERHLLEFNGEAASINNTFFIKD